MTCPTAFHHLDICANVIEILVITPPFNIFAQCSVSIRKILINLWHIAIWRDMTLIPGLYEMKNRWNYWFLFHKTDYAFFNVSKQNWSVTSGHKHRELAVGLWGYIRKMDLTHFLTSNEVTSCAAVQTGAGATRAARFVVFCDPIHVPCI